MKNQIPAKGNRSLALEYLVHFCAGNVDRLEPLLAPDLIFRGTLHGYDSAGEYLESLRRDPPEKCAYTILKVVESDDSVALFYDYEKSDRTIRIAQFFMIRDQKINEMLLVFDGRDFV